jgi:hypothetical protein
MFLAVQTDTAVLLSLHQFPKSKETDSRRSGERRKKIPRKEKSETGRRKKKSQRIVGRNPTEEDPLSDRPFCATFISPLANVAGGGNVMQIGRSENEARLEVGSWQEKGRKISLPAKHVL